MPIGRAGENFSTNCIPIVMHGSTALLISTIWVVETRKTEWQMILIAYNTDFLVGKFSR